MVDVPRHLPRTQQQRIGNVARTHAALSGGGSTAAARPVTNTSASPQRYQAPFSDNIVLGDASGFQSTAITSTASGPGSATASGEAAIAIGEQSLAEADGSVAIGGASLGPDAVRSVAIGKFASCAAGGAVAIGGGESGASAIASGAGSVALGPGALADGIDSVALGYGAHATGNNEMALGGTAAVAIIRGTLVLRDQSTFDLYKLTVSGGSLSVTPYP